MRALYISFYVIFNQEIMQELVKQFLRVIKKRPEEDMQHLYELINFNNFFKA